MHAQGYRGTASVDFVLLRQGGELRAIAAEINAASPAPPTRRSWRATSSRAGHG